MNLQKHSEPAGEQMTLFSQAGSRNYVNPIHTQVKGSEKKMTATCGRKCLEQYGKFSRHGLWAKTLAALLVGMEGWYSTRCKLTWKLKGTKYSRLYFQLVPSTLPTEGIGFGFWPTPMLPGNGGTNGKKKMKQMLLLTPTTREEPQDLEKFKKRMEKYPNGTTMPNLATQVQGLLRTPTAAEAKNQNSSSQIYLQNQVGATPKLLPTPQARDEKNGSQITDGRIQRKMEQGWTIDLNDLAASGLLPTPDCSDRRSANSKQQGLSNVVAGSASQLNPRFVAEMMGFPPDWLELPFQNIETKA